MNSMKSVGIEKTTKPTPRQRFPSVPANAADERARPWNPMINMYSSSFKNGMRRCKTSRHDAGVMRSTNMWRPMMTKVRIKPKNTFDENRSPVSARA